MTARKLFHNENLQVLPDTEFSASLNIANIFQKFRFGFLCWPKVSNLYSLGPLRFAKPLYRRVVFCRDVITLLKNNSQVIRTTQKVLEFFLVIIDFDLDRKRERDASSAYGANWTYVFARATSFLWMLTMARRLRNGRWSVVWLREPVDRASWSRKVPSPRDATVPRVAMNGGVWASLVFSTYTEEMRHCRLHAHCVGCWWRGEKRDEKGARDLRLPLLGGRCATVRTPASKLDQGKKRKKCSHAASLWFAL